MCDVVDIYRSLPVLTQSGIDGLTSKGVPPLALGNSGPAGDVLKQVRGRCAKDGWFEIADDGEAHIAILAYDCLGDPVDIVCWLPKTDAVASIDGRTFALGAEQIFNPGVYSFKQGLVIHRSILNWLKSWRQGAFIIKPELAFDELRDVPAITAEDRNHGHQLKKMLQPTRLPKILVRKQMQEAS